MRALLAVALLLSPVACGAQDDRAVRSAPDEAYTARLVRLVEGLQTCQPGFVYRVLMVIHKKVVELKIQ